MWSKVVGWSLAVVVALGALWCRLSARSLNGLRGLCGQHGQGMVEYAVVVGLVVIVAMGALQYFGQGVTTVFQHVVARITSIG